MTAVNQDARIRSFRQRGGRMGPELRAALASGWPDYGLTAAGEPWDLAAVFPSADGAVLEVGSGMGDATVASAEAEPNLGIIAVEVHVKGVAATLRAARARGLTNIRVVIADAVDVLQHEIEPSSLAAIRVWFPDPWPKKRHNKRRLVNADFVHLACSRLRQGGLLHVATDVAGYASAIESVLATEPGLRADVVGGPRPACRPETRYEAVGIAAGREVWDFCYRRDGTG